MTFNEAQNGHEVPFHGGSAPPPSGDTFFFFSLVGKLSTDLAQIKDRLKED
jgi:hypothetical protein